MINACEILNELATGKQDICSYEEAEMFKDLVYMLTLSGTELNDAMDIFKQKYVSPGFNVGDECYYETNPEWMFVITRIWLNQNGLGEDAYYFDAICHGGETISDGALCLVKKTGNKYKINLEILGG